MLINNERLIMYYMLSIYTYIYIPKYYIKVVYTTSRLRRRLFRNGGNTYTGGGA